VGIPARRRRRRSRDGLGQSSTHRSSGQGPGPRAAQVARIQLSPDSQLHRSAVLAADLRKLHVERV